MSGAGKGEWDGRDMWHAGGRTEIYTGLWLGKAGEKRIIERYRSRGGIMLHWYWKDWDGLEWIHVAQKWRAVVNTVTRLIWHKMQKISRLAEGLKNKRPTWCHLLFYFTSYVLHMFRTLIYPSSGACDYSVELPHLSYCSVKTEDLA